MRQGAAVLAAEDAGPHRRARAAVRAMATVAPPPPAVACCGFAAKGRSRDGS
ncbi:hypothetical protein KHHGKMAE_0647 [Methylobacterium persicinum]|nr:hypothetical protein KHHGKMAE_0647 [Methylobacterium persicinum]